MVFYNQYSINGILDNKNTFMSGTFKAHPKNNRKKECSMAHRPILTERQRNDLMALPTDDSSMLTYYILSDEDIIRIKQKRDDHNQLGFALQLCALRYPGRYLNADDN